MPPAPPPAPPFIAKNLHMLLPTKFEIRFKFPSFDWFRGNHDFNGPGNGNSALNLAQNSNLNLKVSSENSILKKKSSYFFFGDATQKSTGLNEITNNKSHLILKNDKMVKKAISYSLNSEKIAVTSTMESDFADLIKKRENVKIAAEDVALKKKNFAFLLIFLPFTKNK